jgi:molecular chaperone GrpE
MTVGEKGAVDNTPAAETADPKDGKEQGNGAQGAPQGAGPEAAIGGELGSDGEPPADPQLVVLKTELEAAKQTAETATSRLRAVSKAYTELQAEMKSFKERMEHRAKMDSELQAFDQVRAFFDPVMNLKRSLASGGTSQAGDADTLRQGIEMVYQQFMEALHKLGLAEVPGVGATFDPAIHEALGVQPVTDKSLDGKVLAVHTTGFTVRGKVLQAAQVVIGKYEEVAGEA